MKMNVRRHVNFQEGICMSFFDIKKMRKKEQKMKKRLTKLISLLALVTLTITGCGSGDSGTAKEETEDGIKAYVGTSIFEGSLDPVKGAMSFGYPFINNALIRVDSESKYIGDLAKDWKISEDALTYTFYLNDGIKFSDGSDFDAEDVVFTYETVRDNQANNENVDLTRLDTVKAIDDMTVEFHLKEAYSPFLDTTALLQIVPSDAYDKEKFDTQPIGTGAYKVSQYDADQQIILEANENYWKEKPEIEKVTLVNMDSDAAFAAAQSGELDIVMVGANYADEKIDGMTVQKFETMDVRNISLPVRPESTVENSKGESVIVGNNVTSDIAVRKALSIGIDRQKIIDNAFNGIGVPAVNFTDNLLWANTNYYEDNQADEAKKILDEAGWVPGEDGIRVKDGQKCTFDVYASAGDEERYNLAVALAENAKDLGIDIQAKTATWDEIETLQNTAGVVWGWGQYSPTVLESLFKSDKFLSGAFDNVVGYNNPSVDEKINQAFSASNQEEAPTIWKDVQEEANAEYPYLYLVNIQHCYFISDDLDVSVDTQIPHPHGHGSPIICNMSDWKMK